MDALSRLGGILRMTHMALNAITRAINTTRCQSSCLGIAERLESQRCSLIPAITAPSLEYDTVEAKLYENALHGSMHRD
jgi:hypothetical protein